ncbi:hypothetical protein [Moritella sp. Urea-trap-13]|nr:hypothetical protein [Moritella sp. Urea-trap-13]
MPHTQSSTTTSLLLTSVFTRLGISLAIIGMLWAILPYLAG